MAVELLEKAVELLEKPGSSLPSACARIAQRSDAVAQEIEAENRQGQRETRENCHPPRRTQVGLRVLQQQSPTRVGGIAKPQKAEERFDQDRSSHLQEGSRDQERRDVRQDVAPDHAQRARSADD